MPRTIVEDIHSLLQKNLQEGERSDATIADCLASHITEIEALCREEKVDLALRLIKDDAGNRLMAAVESIRHAKEDEQSFHAIMKRALDLNAIFGDLAKAGNTKAAATFLKEVNPDHCHEFAPLLAERLPQQGHDIAANLMATAEDPKERGRIIRMAGQHFGVVQNFAQQCQEAAISLALLDQLEGEHPEAMFASREYNPSLLHQYASLVDMRLAEPTKQQDIAQKLSQCEPTTRNEVLAKLAVLSKSAFGSCPFRAIAEQLQVLIASEADASQSQLLESSEEEWEVATSSAPLSALKQSLFGSSASLDSLDDEGTLPHRPS
ncbi:MAG: hypothetical protein JJT82_02245 [Legionellaceae bacterium]|nr:hypothetical protein [Legionellaceae bacterium]